MKINDTTKKVLRIVLGLFLILYGLNKFLHVVPTGFGEMPETARDFIDGVAVYLPYLYIFEILIGLFLILDFWTPLILILLAPLSFSFVFFVITNGDLTEIWPAVIVAVLNLLLIFSIKDKYLGLLKS
jgi:putative oxidoreductase